jgi:ABC-type multidrug transport system fused ATPase/permease subunit
MKLQLMNNLYKKYLENKYEFHINSNTSILYRNIQIESQILTTNIIQPLMILITDTSFFFLITLFSLFLFPFESLMFLSFICLTLLLYYRFLKNIVSSWGEKRQYFSGLTNKIVLESLNSIKTIKYLNKEDYFITNYRSLSSLLVENESKNTIVQNTPKLFFEFFGIFILAIITILLSHQNLDTKVIFVTIGLIFSIAFKLLPSVNRIGTSLNQLKFGNASLKLYKKEFLDKKTINKPNKKINIKYEKIIRVNDIHFKYPDTNSYTLKNISFEIKKGDFIGIIGKSGSGKSTLVDVLLGLLKPISGSISVDGRKVDNDHFNWTNNIGYVSQDIYLIDDTIAKNIAFGVEEESIDHNRVIESIKYAHLFEYVDSLPKKINTLVGDKGIKLSGGQKQRIGIARALYNKPNILIFDEATSSLDNETEKKIIREINQLNDDHTIISIAHRLSTLEKCNKIIEITSGSINSIIHR